MTTVKHTDKELKELIVKRRLEVSDKLLVVGTGITSSHLGDERNLREFVVANSVVNKLRGENNNVLFYLFDDSYDPLNFRQLRVAVKKDPQLIKKFSEYCGVPIKLIPDPYECHENYSAHFQNEILTRFHGLDIYPSIIDSYSSYESGFYDSAKEIVFHRYKEIKEFLKRNFPKYSMKKIFWPLCPKCLKMDGVDIKRVIEGRVSVLCANCGHRFSDSWKNIRGKFSWKIDAAVKWNAFKVDFEPYSKAYLDPDVGSYFIAKKLSEEFFGGYFPEIVHYGQIIMDKSLSYKILSSIPKDALHSFFLQNRKQDLVLNENKIIQLSRNYFVDESLSFYDYIVSRLPYDIFESLNGNRVHSYYKKFMDPGKEFARFFLNKEFNLEFPDIDIILTLKKQDVLRIRKFFYWVIEYKLETLKITFKDFNIGIEEFMRINRYKKIVIFPLIRKLLSQEGSLPMNRILYYAPLSFLYGCLLMIDKALLDKKAQIKSDRLERNHMLQIAN